MLEAQQLQVVAHTQGGWQRVVDGLSLCIAKGQTFALVGESGCGKSMTALTLMRLLPDAVRVVQGRVRLNERELLALPEREMRTLRGARVSMIFQEPSTSLNPVQRVGDQIAEAIVTHTALRGAAVHERAVSWLRRVGIPEPEQRFGSYPFELSGGQKQRVMIAMALACEPDILVADEPTTALDVTIQAQILTLLRDLQRERRLGVLLITHDLAVVSQMAHRVALMYAGQIVEEADAAAFFARPAHPYARLLLGALPDLAKRGRPLSAIPGQVPSAGQAATACRFAPRCPRADSRCRVEPPPVVELDMAPSSSAEHTARCWYPGYPDSAAALPDAAAGASEVTAPRSPAPQDRAAQAWVLDVRGLRVVFGSPPGAGSRRQEIVAVDGVSLRVPAARTLALVGESGCGKTTLGRAVMQLLRKQASVQGVALFEGRDLFGLQGDALRQARAGLQMVFQDPFASLNPRLRVLDLLEEGLLSLHPEYARGDRLDRVREALDQVGLQAQALSRYPHEFSGGQRQRIAIARALVVQPRLLICDEPTSALDVSVQAQILNLLRELQQRLQLSLLFITHNIGAVSYLADDIAVMYRGRIVETGSAEQVIERPRDDYTRQLLAAVPVLRTAGPQA